MKLFIDGVEREIPKSNQHVDVLSNIDGRLTIRTPAGSETALAVRVGETIHISFRGRQYIVEKTNRRIKGRSASHDGEMRAPMPGLIVDVLVTQGESVANGQKLVVLEAMKTQQPFSAPFEGIVKTLSVEKGKQVAEGEILIVVEPT